MTQKIAKYIGHCDPLDSFCEGKSSLRVSAGRFATATLGFDCSMIAAGDGAP